MDTSTEPTATAETPTLVPVWIAFGNDETGITRWKRATGQRITLAMPGDFAACHVEDDFRPHQSRWETIELNTGLEIGRGNTMDDAITAANKLIADLGDERVQRWLVNHALMGWRTPGDDDGRTLGELIDIGQRSIDWRREIRERKLAEAEAQQQRRHEQEVAKLLADARALLPVALHPYVEYIDKEDPGPNFANVAIDLPELAPILLHLHRAGDESLWTFTVETDASPFTIQTADLVTDEYDRPYVKYFGDRYALHAFTITDALALASQQAAKFDSLAQDLAARQAERAARDAAQAAASVGTDAPIVDANTAESPKSWTRTLLDVITTATDDEGGTRILLSVIAQALVEIARVQNAALANV